MERLQIKDFLSIQHADIDIRPFTVLIGPQASGKSIIAKLSYFFREFLSRHFVRSIQEQTNKPALIKVGLSKFEELFPSYGWGKQQFEIKYSVGDVEIIIKRRLGSGKSGTFDLDYSKNLAQIHRRAKHFMRKELSSSELIDEDSKYDHRIGDIAWRVIQKHVYEDPIGYSFMHSIFIPASRSFFANLQRNVFLFLANSIAIDPLIKEFGSIYESSKRYYDSDFLPRLRRDKVWNEVLELWKGQAETILMGKYVREEDEDWIVSNIGRVNVANASSGQQEALPMMVVLNWRSFLALRNKQPVTYFIEEPEAHLFPKSQKSIVELLAQMYNRTGCGFVVTTHSPYILTAINNLVYASRVVDRSGGKLDSEVNSVIPTDRRIRFADVSAYTVENGLTHCIVESEYGLIGSSVIDSVSDSFDEVFSRLLEIEQQYVR